MTDDQLIHRVRDGDTGAFEELVLRYQKPIYGFVLRLLKDPTEAEDTVQKVFLLVYQNLKNFRFESSFKTWLYRISINQCHNIFRQHKNKEFSPIDDLPLADGKTSQEEDYAQKEMLALAQKAIEKLPTKQRMVLLLRVYQDLSFEEIGKALNIRANSAKVNFHYALGKIKERMKNQP
ncbi:MAG: RNA polymerase sigma factor [Deltaproteobacteria bacterium]|nr:RNA polymerase sigma factor [Deltaproteobacteria bacterium]